MSEVPVVELVDVYKVYHMPAGDVHALNGVTFSVMKGEFVAIMGPSGSGKSTLMNMIGCLDVPTAGDMYIDGRNVKEMTDDELEGYFRTNPLKPYTPKSIRTHQALREELDRTRERGWSVDDEEHEENVFCIAAPVKDYTGRTIAALSVSWPIFRFNREGLPELAGKIAETTSALSKVLGYIPE